MEPFGSTGPGREIKATFASFQWPTGSAFRGDASSRPPLGMINIIFAVLGKTGSCPSRVMSVSCCLDEGSSSMSKRVKMGIPLVLGFSNEDKVGTVQPQDDALVVTLRIGGYDMKRVMIDQGSAAEIMYPELFKGLNLKPKNLTAYNSPLVSFEGKMVISKGQIRLPVQTGSNVVEVDFIVVDALSIYSHYEPTLALYLGSRFLYSSPKGEVSLKRPSAGNIGKPIYG